MVRLETCYATLPTGPQGVPMSGEIIYRPATTDDIRPAYAVFSRCLHQYLFQQGLIDEITARDPPIDVNWKLHSIWIEHLWGSAAENWVAQDTPVAFSAGQ